MSEESFSKMLGRTMRDVAGKVGGYSLRFTAEDGSVFEFYHGQDCCESVTITDIAGDLTDLVGSPILLAELVSCEPQGDPAPEHPDSWTWSFYKYRTHKGDVTVRWLGESNGYYGETVSYHEEIAK